jgi:transcriptional regulator with XRE-family HTH domain
MSTGPIFFLLNGVIMLSLDQITALLQDRKLTTVSKAAGLSHQAVWRLAKGHSKSPSYETIKKLSDYFESQSSIEV